MTEPVFTELVRLRDDATSDAPAVTVDSFAEQSNAGAVRIEPGDDTRELLPHLSHVSRVEINFPAFTDGRGYSAAQILREAGYDGEIRAVGDVAVDQLAYMRRCGFDAFQPDTPMNEADVKTAFERWDHVYQKTSDGRTPIWALRHNGGGNDGGADG